MRRYTTYVYVDRSASTYNVQTRVRPYIYVDRMRPYTICRQGCVHILYVDKDASIYYM